MTAPKYPARFLYGGRRVGKSVAALIGQPLLPFYAWKDGIKRLEAPLVRPKAEYHQMYGAYVQKHRLANPPMSAPQSTAIETEGETKPMTVATMHACNMNNYVRVKLSAYGRAHHAMRHAMDNMKSGGQLEYTPPVEDAEGYSTWQLWSLMREFGDQMYMGNTRAPFESMNFQISLESP